MGKPLLGFWLTNSYTVIQEVDISEPELFSYPLLPLWKQFFPIGNTTGIMIHLHKSMKRSIFMNQNYAIESSRPKYYRDLSKQNGTFGIWFTTF